MTFLAMIIALSLHQVLRDGNPLQRDAWLGRWDAFIAGFSDAPALRALLVLLGVSVLLAWGLDLLDGWLFGLPQMLATAGLLVWSLGREDFHTALERYEARLSTDASAASAALEDLWMPPLMDDGVEDAADPGAEPGAEAADRPLATDAPRQIDRQRLAYAGYSRWFAPLFYFVLAGPIAAVAYRMLAILAADKGDTVYLRPLSWADWAPARLLGLSFALTGNFIAVSQRGPLSYLADTTPAPLLLRELGDSACAEAPGARALGGILYRSAALWLLLIGAWLIFR